MTASSSYQPTFLQKLLGRNYKWWYLVKYEFKRSSGHFPSFITNSSIRAVEFLAIIYIWKLNNAVSDIITYLAVGRVFGRLIASWLDIVIANYILKGNLTRFLLFPTNALAIITVGDFGFNFIRQSINAFLTLILAIIIFRSDVVLNWNVIWIIPFFFIALIIKVLFNWLIGFTAFWSNNSNNTSTFIESIKIAASLLAGETIPLFVIFAGFLNPILWTPFTYFLHHPMQIYLGKYTPIETLYVFLGGIAWCIALYFLAKLVFRLGLKKNEAVGL